MIPVKEIAPYLPYGLCFYGATHIWTLSGVTENGDVLLTNGLHIHSVFSNETGTEYAPILRPMSALTPEDEEDIYYHEQEFDSTQPTAQAVVRLNWLLSRHYDIFGLIERGVAVDISQFKQTTT